MLIYPDVYEVGLPNQGIAILYRNLNETPGHVLRARVHPLDRHGGRHARGGVPLLSLEGAAPIASFDVVGFHVPHEMACTNYLEGLDLAGIPLHAADRGEDDPIVIAAAHRCTTPSRTRPSSTSCSSVRARSSCSSSASCIASCVTKESRARRLCAQLSQVGGAYVPLAL